MAFCDFVVNYDPEKDTSLDITKKILYSVIIKRYKSKKPSVIFIGGDSGEGKSYAALRLQELLMEIMGEELVKYLEAMNVFIPIEYADKLDNLLTNKDLKKAIILCIHEARTLVKAKLWNTFVSQTISDVNALTRSVKRLITIVISQFIRDITTDVRYTINFYCTVRRPKGKATRLYFNVMWKDDRDLEKPKLRKRRLSGYLKYPNGRYKRFVPEYLEMSKPSKEVIDLFEDRDRNAKAKIIKNKLKKLMTEMSKEIGDENKKIDLLVDYYIQNVEHINQIGRQVRGKWKVNHQFKDIHELNSDEAKEFESKFNNELIEKGVLESEDLDN